MTRPKRIMLALVSLFFLMGNVFYIEARYHGITWAYPASAFSTALIFITLMVYMVTTLPRQPNRYYMFARGCLQILIVIVMTVTALLWVWAGFVNQPSFK